MVVDASEIEAQMNLIVASVDEILIGLLVDLSLYVHFIVIGQSVDFVYEDFEFDVRIDAVRFRHVLIETS